MSTAKKQDIPEPEEQQDDSQADLSQEFDFDVNNDWRKEADATSTNIFKEDDMEVGDDDMDTSIFELDTKGEIAKEAEKEHSKAMAAARKHARKKKGEDSDTLKSLQEAAAGGEGADGEELEILTEEDKALVNDPIFTNKGDQYPQIHGNYFLLDHLVDGGMAKVCRARYLGEGDEADKMVAIKMVQEKFSADEGFVQMFVDEIKVSFGLNHPNINTTFDYGKIGKNLFVSMEYIHGKDLMVVINELKKNKETIPIPMCIYIASKMSEALHYAHNFTNKLTGQKYNIVHRDISPHNAMVSYEGFVKVIDFGIAKADTNTTEEAEGTIKGKINYFAPEYLEGKKIDHRYDQFAVGLTLWEMLTGRKTFTGSDQLLTLKTILECNPQLPSKYNKDVPKALEQVVMKSLSKDPANRYKDMQAFQRALMKVLYQTYPDFHESDIGEMMKNLFQDSYEKDLERFKEFGQYSITDIVAKIKAFKDFQQRQKEKAQSSGGKAKEMVFDFGFTEEAVSVRGNKKGLAGLGGGKKAKEKPGLSMQKSQRQRQKALAALLEEDEDFVQADSPWQQHKGKLLFLGLLALGFFQRELITNTLFGVSKKANGLVTNKAQYQKSQQEIEIEEAKSALNEKMKFLDELKKKNKKQAGAKAKAKPLRQKTSQRAKKVPARQAPVVTKSQVQEVLNKVKQQTASKPAQRPVQRKPPSAPVQAQRQPASPGRPQVTSFKEAKAILENTMNKEKAVKIEGALEAARPALTEAPKEVQKQVEQAVDIDSLSIEELRARMEAQLAKRRQQVEQKPSESRSQLDKRVEANVQPAETQPQLESSAEANVQPAATQSGFESEGQVQAEALAEEEYSEDSPTDLGNSMPEQSLNEAAKDVLSQIKAKQAAPREDTKTPSAERPLAKAEESVPSVPAAPELSDTEKQLLQLKAKMARIEEEQKRAEEGERIEKVDISLSEEPTAQELADQEKSKEEIQRELASRLDEISEEGDEATDDGEKGLVDGVVDFIKTRRAFGWMFD